MSTIPPSPGRPSHAAPSTPAGLAAAFQPTGGSPRPATKEAQDLAVAIAKQVDEYKGRDITVLNVAGLCSFTDIFILATVESTTQMRAMIETVAEDLSKRGKGNVYFDPILFDTTWGVMDCGDVVVHLFLREAREFYDLEHLWGDAPTIAWQ